MLRFFSMLLRDDFFPQAKPHKGGTVTPLADCKMSIILYTLRNSNCVLTLLTICVAFYLEKEAWPLE